MKVKFEGLEELIDKIGELRVSEDIEKKALETAGDYFVEKVKDVTPVSKAAGGGKLRDSIERSEYKEGKVSVGSYGKEAGFRAHFIEYGTSKMPAQPYMRPTFEREVENLERIIAEEVKKGLGL